MTAALTRTACFVALCALVGDDARHAARVDAIALRRPVRAHNARAAIAIGMPPAATRPTGGAGVTIGQWDLGAPRSTHVDLAGRVQVMDDATPSEHATHVAGTMVGLGLGDGAAIGIAGGARLLSFDQTRDLAELATHAHQLALSNHAYGPVLGLFEQAGCAELPTFVAGERYEDPWFGKYVARAAELDRIAADTGLPIVWSAGNDRTGILPAGAPHHHGTSCEGVFTDSHAPQDGYDTLGGPAVAKNALTVGAVAAFDPQTMSAEDIVPLAGSSFGPMDDGRIKPDLVASAEGVLSTSSAGDDAYAIMGGTSSAAAVVSGALGLLVGRYRAARDGVDPFAEELKALAVACARDDAVPGPDYRIGHGLLDVGAMLQLLDQDGSPGTGAPRRLRVDRTGGETRSYQSEPLPAGTPLRIALAWTDPPAPDNGGGVDDPSPALVHDLDVTLVAPGGATFHAYRLDPSQPAAPATRGRNGVDNVEVVGVRASENGQAGRWELRVDARGGLTDPQRFALASSVPFEGAGQAVLAAPRTLVLHVTAPTEPVGATIPLRAHGAEALTWSAATDASWLVLEPDGGTTPGELVVSVDAAALEPGEHDAVITVDGADPTGPRRIGVRVHVECNGLTCGLCHVCEAGSCMPRPDGAPCDDGDACTLDDSCNAGDCGGSPRGCGGAGACQQARCDATSGQCQVSAIEGCCLGDDECDDGDPCTLDRCDPDQDRCAVQHVEGCCTVDADCGPAPPCFRALCESNTCRLSPAASCPTGDGGAARSDEPPESAPTPRSRKRSGGCTSAPAGPASAWTWPLLAALWLWLRRAPRT